MGARESIAVEGGPLDGMIGTISPESSKLGFFVYWPESEGGGGLVWGYYARERVDRGGHRVFSPGKARRSDEVHSDTGV